MDMSTMDAAGAERRRLEIERRLGEIEDELYDLKDERDRLEYETEKLDKAFPPPPEPDFVGEFHVGGVRWLTDGWRALACDWPAGHDLGRQVDVTKAAEMITALDRERPTVTVVAWADAHDGLPFAVLSDGVVVRRDWLQSAIDAAGLGFTIHSDGSLGAVSLRAAAGDLRAVLMPTSETPNNRRPPGT